MTPTPPGPMYYIYDLYSSYYHNTVYVYSFTITIIPRSSTSIKSSYKCCCNGSKCSNHCCDYNNSIWSRSSTIRIVSGNRIGSERCTFESKVDVLVLCVIDLALERI